MKRYLPDIASVTVDGLAAYVSNRIPLGAPFVAVVAGTLKALWTQRLETFTQVIDPDTLMTWLAEPDVGGLVAETLLRVTQAKGAATIQLIAALLGGSVARASNVLDPAVLMDIAAALTPGEVEVLVAMERATHESPDSDSWGLKNIAERLRSDLGTVEAEGSPDSLARATALVYRLSGHGLVESQIDPIQDQGMYLGEIPALTGMRTTFRLTVLAHHLLDLARQGGWAPPSASTD